VAFQRPGGVGGKGGGGLRASSTRPQEYAPPYKDPQKPQEYITIV